MAFPSTAPTPPLIICFGDSLTAGFQSPTPASPVGRETPYGHVLQTRLGNRARVAVSGVCGEVTGEMLLRFRTDVLDHHPAFVVILGGTNDLGWNAQPPEIMRNLVKMYELARADRITPVAVTVPSLRADGWVAGAAAPSWVASHVERRLELNRLIAGYAVSQGVPWVDLFAKTAEAETRLLAAPYSNDGLHFTTEGYTLLADLLYERVFATAISK